MTMKPSYDNPLNGIVEGMTVYDANGERVGTVAEVHLGGEEREDLMEGRADSASEDIRRAGENVTVDNLSEVFDMTEMSEDIARTLLNSGYIRVESDELTGAASYLLPDRVSLVHDGQVTLASSLENLKEYPHPGKGERRE